MDRRGFVAALAIISSGCLGRDQNPDGSGNETPENASENVTDSREDAEGTGVTLADREDAIERFGDLVGRTRGDGDPPIAEFGTDRVIAGNGVVDSEDIISDELHGAALVYGNNDEGYPLLHTAVASSSEETVQVDTVAVPPYDGVGEHEDTGSEAALRAVPTGGHDLVGEEEVSSTDGGQSRTDVLSPTVKFEPRAGYVGEYALVTEPEEVPDGIYLFEGPNTETSLEIAVWNPQKPGPSERSRFEGRNVPELPGRFPTSWYHEADETTPVYLEPSEERVEAPATVEFTLTNRSDGFVSGNPEEWYLYKLVGGDWYRIEPWGHRLPAATYPPGTDATDRKRLVHGEEEEGVKDGVVRIDRLGGGTYAYSVGMRRDDETNAALFELEAPPAELVAPEDVSVDREGGEVVVTLEGSDYEEVVTVERTDADGKVVITEQMYRHPYRALRYSVPFFDEDTERVRVRGLSSFYIPNPEEDVGTYVYSGQAYEVTVDE